MAGTPTHFDDAAVAKPVTRRWSFGPAVLDERTLELQVKGRLVTLERKHRRRHRSAVAGGLFYLSDPEAAQQAISDMDISTICKQGGTRQGEPRDRNVERIFRLP